MLEYYFKQLGPIPSFLKPYLSCPSLLRLQDVGYFCGMDYASKEIYPFKEVITRYDHSLTTALNVWRLTSDERMTLAGLFHDISTPCFSHVIDYMNEDFERQESTEAYTEQVLFRDSVLKKLLFQDGITLEEVSDFKRYPIVDNDRPKVCADRIDGIILTGGIWSKQIDEELISQIISDLQIYQNEEKEEEIGFQSLKIAKQVLEISNQIDVLCHSSEDNYMMQLLASITKAAITSSMISYSDLYKYNEKELFQLLKTEGNSTIQSLLYEFQTKKKEEIPTTEIPKVKVRALNPLVGGHRLLDTK